MADAVILPSGELFEAPEGTDALVMPSGELVNEATPSAAATAVVWWITQG